MTNIEKGKRDVKQVPFSVFVHFRFLPVGLSNSAVQL